MPYNQPKKINFLSQLDNITNPADGDIIIFKDKKFTNDEDVKINVDEHNLSITTSAPKTIRIGYFPYGDTTNDKTKISIGANAGNSGEKSVAIGYDVFTNNIGSSNTSIGYQSTRTKISGGGPVDRMVSIGYSAGSQNKGQNSVSIGAQSGLNNQKDRSIVINATSSSVSGSLYADAFSAAPIRRVDMGHGNVNALYYDTTSGEITYSGN